MKRWQILILFLLIRIPVSMAQTAPLGQWKAHFSYVSARHVVQVNDKIYCSSYNGLFYLDTLNKQVRTLSKSDGLSETGISSMAYNVQERTLLLAYRSGTIDLVALTDNAEPDQIKPWNIFSSVTDLPANKQINKIVVRDSLTFLATNFGIVVLDIKQQQVQETYRYIGKEGSEIAVRDIAFDADSIYVLTTQGLLASSMQPSVNRQYFANWKAVATPFPAVSIVSQNKDIHAGLAGKGIYKKTGVSWNLVYPDNSMYYALSGSSSRIIATMDSHLVILAAAGQPALLKSPQFASPQESILTGSKTVWTADRKNGLISNLEGDFKSYSIFEKDTTINPVTDSVVTDRNGLAWTRLPAYLGDGISVKNMQTGQQRILTTTAGSGGLPSSVINSLSVDNDGYIWFASNKGVGYFWPDEILSGNRTDAILPVYGQRKLFSNEKCTALAVEPGNRKWIGTNNGVYQFTEDGTEMIRHFTAVESPLPSDIITALKLEPETGVLFMDTPNGMVSYQSNSTAASENFSSVTIFPNPVRPGYSGQVGIKGLMDNSTVKITQLSGRLVYETQSQGGTATWNLTDYTGRRAAGGIYMIIIVSGNGEKKLAGKLAVIN